MFTIVDLLSMDELERFWTHDEAYSRAEWLAEQAERSVDEFLIWPE